MEFRLAPLDRGMSYSLAEIEDQIFKREGIRVVFRTFDLRRHWRSYTYDRAVAKSSAMSVFHQRVRSYVGDDVPYVVVDGRGQCIMAEDISVDVIRSSYR